MHYLTQVCESKLLMDFIYRNICDVSSYNYKLETFIKAALSLFKQQNVAIVEEKLRQQIFAAERQKSRIYNVDGDDKPHKRPAVYAVSVWDCKI